MAVVPGFDRARAARRRWERPAERVPDTVGTGYPTVRRCPRGGWDYWAVADSGIAEDDFTHGWTLAEGTLAEVRRRAEAQGSVALADTWPVLVEIIKAADAAGGDTAHGFFARIWHQLRR